MIGILTFLGVLAMFSSVTLFIVNFFTRKKDVTIKNSWGDETTLKAHPKILTMWDFKKSSFLFLVGGLLLFISNSIMFARPGHQYHIISPNGKEYVITKSGYKFILPLSKIQEWEKYVDVKVVNDGESIRGISGPIIGGIPIRFTDQVTANASVSVRMEMPSDPESFISLVKEFRHPDNIVKNTLVPTVREQVINTAYMFTARDYISGSRSDFKQTLDDQLKSGSFSVVKKEYLDTSYVNTDIANNKESRQIKDIKTRYIVEKRLDENGIPIRIPHDITKNNINVTQVIVDGVDLEPAFRKRLEKQRDIASQKSLEMEAIEAAKISQQKIIAEGERDKARERAEREKEQVTTLISIETRVKEERSNEELAEIQLRTERLKAEAKKVQADAQSYENAKLVSAGLTPQEKANIEKEIIIGYASQMKNLKLPEVYIQGGSESKDNDFLRDLISADMAKKMMENTEK